MKYRNKTHYTDGIIKHSQTLWLVGLVALVAAVIFPAAVLAQTPDPSPYECRAFVGDGTTDGTYQFNLAAASYEYVCPYCHYSSPYPGECPDPFDADAHPANVDLVQVPIGQQRAFDITVQDLGAAYRDIEYTDADGNVTGGAAVIGKVFHPYDDRGTADTSDDIDRNSTLNVLSCDMENADGADDIDDTSHLRFFVMPPGVTRPCAQPVNIENTDCSSAGKTLDDDEIAAAVRIGINPFRVTHGDRWWIYYRQYRNAAGEVSRVDVKISSVVYGLDLDVEDINPTADALDPTLSNTYISDSGAVMAEFTHLAQHGGDDCFDVLAGEDETWVFQFDVTSNSRLLPGVADMSGHGAPVDVDDAPGATEAAWNALSQKECWLDHGSGSAVSGGIATDSTVAESGDALEPFVLAPDWTGTGMVAVQYAGDADHTNLITPPPGPPGPSNANTYRFYEGGAWQYDYQEDVTNEDVARKLPPGNFIMTGPADPSRQWVQYIGEAHFFCSKVELQNVGNNPNIKNDEWEFGWSGRPYLTSTFPRLIIGLRDLGGQWIQGVYGPGSLSETMLFPLFNRLSDGPDKDPVYRCPFCGAVQTDTTCPYHDDDTDAELMDLNYSARLEMMQSLSAAGNIETDPDRDETRHLMPEDAVKFHDTNRYVRGIEDTDDPSEPDYRAGNLRV
ncbi:MAG: hypothetical protein ACLFWB_08255, partial [Armatimonadota bacterium]